MSSELVQVADFALMQGIKSLFDPRGLMNPGVLL